MRGAENYSFVAYSNNYRAPLAQLASLRPYGSVGPEGAAKNMFYVYLLKSDKDKKYYIGQTNNIEQRLLKHNSGMIKSTRNRRPLNLVGYEKYESRGKAMWRETEIKNNASKRYKFIDKIKRP
ncbi:MAG: GIY-YIG nuclease family protein [Candidatus Paceibacterota bacterium]